MNEAVAFVLIFSVFVFVFGLFSRRFEKSVITAQMVFVTAGLFVSTAGIGLIDLAFDSGIVLLVAETALVLTLFSDASRINLLALRKGGAVAVPGRMLVIGLPLTIAAGTIAAVLIFTDLTIWEAAIIGAILAPTDAALGQAIVNSSRIPVRIRQALNVESGLNDGISIPFLFVFVALAEAEAQTQSLPSWIEFALAQIGFGVLVGLLVGGLGGWFGSAATQRGWMTRTYQWFEFLALALIAWIAADAIGGSGFIAAFVAGLLIAVVGHQRGINIGEMRIGFTEAEGEILNLAVFFIFGIVAATLLAGLTLTVVLYAVLSLTAIRMLPVAISLAGTGLSRISTLFLGWFGPRGLASIVLVLTTMEEAPGIGGLDTISLVVTVTVLLSVFAHGISALPGIDLYAGHAEPLAEDAAEKKEVREIPTRRRGKRPEE